MKNLFRKIFLLFGSIATLYGCGIAYTKQLAGIYTPYNEKNEVINENAILSLSPNGNFVYEVEKQVLFQGNWRAREIKEMTTIDFNSENREWKSSGGSFNPPQCNQIIIWNPKYFNLTDSNKKVIFKKR